MEVVGALLVVAAVVEDFCFAVGKGIFPASPLLSPKKIQIQTIILNFFNTFLNDFVTNNSN